MYEYVFDFGGLVCMVYLVFDVYIGVFIGVLVFKYGGYIVGGKVNEWIVRV